jgi:cytochrome b561
LRREKVKKNPFNVEVYAGKSRTSNGSGRKPDHASEVVCPEALGNFNLRAVAVDCKKKKLGRTISRSFPQNRSKSMSPAPTTGYGAVAKILHWLIFALLAVQYAIGSIMPHIGRHTQDEGWVAWHFSVGAAILFFIVLRLAWRLFHPVPQLPTLTPWERVSAGFVHWALYLLVLVMTLLGWAAANARGWDVHLFGMATLPAIAPNGSHWGHEAGDIHNILVYVLLGFIVLHVAAALYHYFVKRDQVVARMLPASGEFSRP